MKFSHEVRYAAPASEVHAMLADPAFREQVCEAGPSVEHSVRITPDGAGMTVVVEQTQPADGIPSFAKKFVGDRIDITQREVWSGTGGADVEVTIPGKPGHFRGTVKLVESGGETVETVAGEVKVSIPLVGGKLEALIGDLFRSALRGEEEVGRRWLAG
jgi:hypothetical protein